ncbi:hypothetical protein Tco_0848189 [Tanacetum coccineum]
MLTLRLQILRDVGIRVGTPIKSSPSNTKPPCGLPPITIATDLTLSHTPDLVPCVTPRLLSGFLFTSYKVYLPGYTNDRSNLGQAPLVNEEKAMVLHTSEEKSSQEDTSRKKETNDEPPTKKLKLLIPPSLIPLPTPLKSIMPEPPKYTEAVKMTLA